MPDIPAFHVEAKLHGFRRTADGVVVSFVLHPAEVPSALALDPLGTRYMLALAAIGDDEQPIELASLPPAERPGVETGSSPTARARASEMGKERYRGSMPMQQARDRAGILPGDLRFQQWVASETGGVATEEHAKLYIRARCCGRDSRSYIATNPDCYDQFIAMETEYKIATGQMAEPR